MREVPANQASIRMEHVPDCLCCYGLADLEEVKMIDARCIAAYLVPSAPFQELLEIIDEAANRKHSANGEVAKALRKVLERDRSGISEDAVRLHRRAGAPDPEEHMAHLLRMADET